MPIAQRPDDLPSRDEVLSLSGLEFMQAILAGRISGPPIGDTLGYGLHIVEDGRVVFRGAPQFSTTNPMGSCMAAGTARFSTAPWPAR